MQAIFSSLLIRVEAERPIPGGGLRQQAPGVEASGEVGVPHLEADQRVFEGGQAAVEQRPAEQGEADGEGAQDPQQRTGANQTVVVVPADR